MNEDDKELVPFEPSVWEALELIRVKLSKLEAAQKRLLRRISRIEELQQNEEYLRAADYQALSISIGLLKRRLPKVQKKIGDNDDDTNIH